MRLFWSEVVRRILMTVAPAQREEVSADRAPDGVTPGEPHPNEFAAASALGAGDDSHEREDDRDFLVLGDGPFTAIATSSFRTFTGRLRRAIEVRDRHCQHPSGCDVPAARCDVDHIVPFTDGGETCQFNGRLECRPHNRDASKHDHGATSHPQRSVTILDEIRARLRWQYLRELAGNDGDDDPDEPAA